MDAPGLPHDYRADDSVDEESSQTVGFWNDSGLYDTGSHPPDTSTQPLFLAPGFSDMQGGSHAGGMYRSPTPEELFPELFVQAPAGQLSQFAPVNFPREESTQPYLHSGMVSPNNETTMADLFPEDGMQPYVQSASFQSTGSFTPESAASASFMQPHTQITGYAPEDLFSGHSQQPYLPGTATSPALMSAPTEHEMPIENWDHTRPAEYSGVTDPFRNTPIEPMAPTGMISQISADTGGGIVAIVDDRITAAQASSSAGREQETFDNLKQPPFQLTIDEFDDKLTAQTRHLINESLLPLRTRSRSTSSNRVHKSVSPSRVTPVYRRPRWAPRACGESHSAWLDAGPTSEPQAPALSDEEFSSLPRLGPSSGEQFDEDAEKTIRDRLKEMLKEGCLLLEDIATYADHPSILPPMEQYRCLATCSVCQHTTSTVLPGHLKTMLSGRSVALSEACIKRVQGRPRRQVNLLALCDGPSNQSRSHLAFLNESFKREASLCRKHNAEIPVGSPNPSSG